MLWPASVFAERRGLLKAGNFGLDPHEPLQSPWPAVCLLSMNESSPNPVRGIQRSPDGASQAGKTTQSSDAELLDGLKARDQQAMADLFDRYSGLVYSVALRVVGETGQAEDVMQEIFFQLWKSPHAFTEGRGSLAAWLAVVARNRAVDILRRRRPSDPVEDVVLVSSTNLASEVERNTIMERVRGALSSLPSEQLRTVELAFFEGLTHSEIAAKTGDPLGTVKTRIRSALISLRKAVQA